MINLCLDVGMLLTPDDKWFGCYRAYGNDKYGFHNDNQIAYKLEEKEKAVSYGKQYVINGADGTYAVLTDQGECLNGDDGEFDDGCVEGFTYNKKDIIFSIAKINGKIVENFANDSGGTKMDLSKEEKNDINIRLTEIQTILENDLYEDRLEEQELIKERKELEHLLEVS